MPPYKRTAGQSAQRNHFANATIRWRDLSEAQRSAWAALAADPPEPDYNRFGELITLTGLQWYTRCNSRLLAAGQDTIDDAPTGDRPVSVENLTVGWDWTSTPHSAIASHTDYPSVSGWRRIILGALTRSASIQAVQRMYRTIKVEADWVGHQAVFTTEWEEYFPLTAPGKRAWCRIVIQDDNGLRSQPADYDSDVV
jgi:hypothetical protein